VPFAPASHLKTQFQAIMSVTAPGAGLGGIVALGLRAVDTSDPGLHVQGLMTPRAAALFPQTATRCYDALSKPDSFGGVPLDELLDRTKDLAPLLNAVGESDPEHLRMRTPVRIEQGLADPTVFESLTKQLVDEYKANNVKVVYRTYPGVSHQGVVDAAASDATKWIRTRLKR
jgi:fermentation-respiration switch protein FrsA (DUF1100 family)